MLGGFALVVTLSLMVLLTLLAVGLLSLSAVALRGSSQGEAMALARGNARLAMMLALGELQKHAGPDRICPSRRSHARCLCLACLGRVSQGPDQQLSNLAEFAANVLLLKRDVC